MVDLSVFPFSYRVIYINKLVSDAEFLCYVLTQRLYAVTLCGMMPRLLQQD